MIEGKVIVRALRDDAGNPITTKPEAELAREKFMAPFTLATKAEALQSLAGKLADDKAELARLEDEQNPPLSIVSAWSEYIASTKRPDTGPDTLAVYEGQFGQFQDWMAENHHDATTLRDITEEIAEEYAGHLNHGRLSPNTFNKHIRVLELVFRVLFKKAKLTVNPWEDIKRKELTTSSRRELTVEELQKVCRSATGDLRPLLALGVYTGLRLRDCVTLRWGEVDLARGIIRRVPHKTARRRPVPVIIPIHPSLRAELEALPRSAKGDYLLPALATEYTSGGAGKKRVIDRIQDHFASQGTQIYAPGTGPGTGKRAVVEVGFHSLRHTFVSLCRESNAPLAVVESIVGHSNPAMTRHYTHVGELAAGQAVAALPAVIGDTKPAQAKPAPEAILHKARAIVESITGKNWRANKAALLALLNAAGAGQPAPKTAN
jgi:integrase